MSGSGVLDKSAWQAKCDRPVPKMEHVARCMERGCKRCSSKQGRQSGSDV
jgi:hypothetical protein